MKAAFEIEMVKEKEIKKIQRQLQLPPEEELAKLVNLCLYCQVYDPVSGVSTLFEVGGCNKKVGGVLISADLNSRLHTGGDIMTSRSDLKNTIF